MVYIDTNGDRIGDYTIWHLHQHGHVYQPMITVYMTKDKGRRVEINDRRFWGASGMKPPPDTPVCGFYNELCPHDTTSKFIIVR